MAVTQYFVLVWPSMPKTSQWASYQRNNLRRRGKKKRAFIIGSGVSLAAIGLICGSILVTKVAFSGRHSQAQAQLNLEEETQRTFNLVSEGEAKGIVGILGQIPSGNEIALEIDGKRTTLEPKLQRLVHQLLRQARPMAGAVVVTDAQTGNILAMAGYDKSAQNTENFLPISSEFPAASIFKIVTAAAALEKGRVQPNTPLRTVGNPYRVNEQKMSDRQLRRGHNVSLEYALAKSYNVAFADLAQRFLNQTELMDAAKDFGFNRNLPFSLPVHQSQAVFPAERYHFAKDATGLSDNTISPLHGAVLAGAFANGGVGLTPTLFADSSTQPFIRISPALSQKLSEMMEKTLTVGTSHRAFRGMSRHPVLKNAIMGGKTGSLSCKNFQGDCDWFVGFGKHQGRRIGLSVIMVHGPYWHQKSSYLARKIFEAALNPETQMAALTRL